MLETQPLHYVVAYRETSTSPWRRGGDHAAFPAANDEAVERGLYKALAYVVAAWPSEDSMNLAVARLNTPPKEPVTSAEPPGINDTWFTDWWRRLDVALIMLDEPASTMGEARDYYIAETVPSMAAIQLRAARIKLRKLEGRP